MVANVSTRAVKGAESVERVVTLLAVLAVVAVVARWEGSLQSVPAIEPWADAASGDAAGAIGAGVLLASSTVPDVVRENSAAIGALLALALGAILLLRIVSYLTTGF